MNKLLKCICLIVLMSTMSACAAEPDPEPTEPLTYTIVEVVDGYYIPPNTYELCYRTTFSNGLIIDCWKEVSREEYEREVGVSESIVDPYDLMDYAHEKTVYGWHISDLVIYDKPLDICTFRKWCNENCELCVLDYTHCPNSIPHYESGGRTMTFYIPPFWCGVIATVLGEFIALVTYGVVRIVKDKRNSTFRRK